MGEPPEEEQLGEDTAELEANRCPECGELVEVVGRMPPAAAVGTHRAKVHGYVSETSATGKRRARDAKAEEKRGPGRPRKAEKVSPIRVLTDAAGEAKGKAAPTADKLAAAMGKVYGYGTYFVAAGLVEGDPRLEGDSDAEDRMIDYLAASDTEAIATVRPLARALAGTGINRRYGRTLVDNVDIVETIGAIADQARRWRRYGRDRKAAEEGRPVASTMPGPAPGTVRHAGGMVTSQPGTQGIVVTPDMIRANGAPRSADRGPAAP